MGALVMMLSRLATEARCELLHKAAHSRTIQLAGHDVCVIWCSECDHVRATRLHGHDISIREDFVAQSLQESCEEMADRLADLLPMDKANAVRIIGSRAELAEHNRRKAERRLARWQGLAVLCALVALCVFLSGCLTPAKLAEMAQRADTLSKGAKTDECADAAANAASAVVVALGDMIAATKMSDPVRSPKSALRLAEVACLECVRDKDCATDEECVGGHCQKRRK